MRPHIGLELATRSVARLAPGSIRDGGNFCWRLAGDKRGMVFLRALGQASGMFSIFFSFFPPVGECFPRIGLHVSPLLVLNPHC